MEATINDASILIAVVVILASLWTAGILKLANSLWLRPKRLEETLRKQGLRGNHYRLLFGDIRDLVALAKHHQPKSIQISEDPTAHALPYYHRHGIKYGQNSFIWFGTSPRLVITEPTLLKEILAKPDVFHKIRPDPIGETAAGGLLYLEDHKWATHRRIVSPAFHIDKLKKMVPTMWLSCRKMVEKWESSSTAAVDVWPELQDLTGDVISRTAFSSSHEEGWRIFELQKELVHLILEILIFTFIPGWRYIPTKANRRMKTISNEIHTLLRGIIDQREKAIARGEAIEEDLLSTLMESNKKEIQEHGNKKSAGGMNIEEVIEECKLFYFAGSETTSSLLVWTMVMLSIHQDWQARAREEVLQVFGKQAPTFDGLNHLRTVTMILYEVMRVYTPVPLLARSITKPIQLGDMKLPVGVDLLLLPGLIHHDPKIWGDDVEEFKPERFSEGILRASKSPFAFTPFSSGPRVCIGQHYAMIEAKIAIATILQHFSFELSKSYLHAPFAILTLQPQYGAPLLLHKL
ncbi:cytochrome P450 72A397-like [Andrographis paniculata]|uniref:cytochrome P450 72A397-like n=1 Tax=Andrographis paniculata TaxID=175694 RepID=UPI0021E8BD58|nr:cytochrome P450 72A397-like [Andrographis paniculata]